MGVIPNFSAQDVEAAMRERVARIDKAIVFTMQYMGEKCIRIARERGNFTDRTGNLRNSEGYIIVRYGEIIQSNFRRSAKVDVITKTGKKRITTGSKDGVQVGQQYAEELAKEYPNGYALIVVAGMHYAVWVEEKYHFDVLTSAEHYAEQNFPRMWAQLRTNIAKMK